MTRDHGDPVPDCTCDPNPGCPGEYHGADGGACAVCGWDAAVMSARAAACPVTRLIAGESAIAWRADDSAAERRRPGVIGADG